MKRCPECRRDYYDDTLLYCLDDGNALLEGPASSGSEPGAVETGFPSDEPQTAILHETALPNEAATRAQIHTTEAEPRDSLNGSTEKRSFSAHRAAKPLAALIVGVLILAGGFFGYRYFARANSKQIESIAVMPFVNESGNADVDYLSDGMTETLISSLSQLPNLNIKPRSLVFRYKGKDVNPETIGRELSVQAVLTGRVASRGSDLSLFVELIDVASTKVIWSQRYDRKQSDIVSLQSEIARDVSGKLKSGLSGADEIKVTKSSTTNPEAYRLYLLANSLAARRKTKDLRAALEYYERAIDLDPNYALAYTGLASGHTFMALYGGIPGAEELPKARSAAMKALEIDPNLPEAHNILGSVELFLGRDFQAIERETKRALELNPNLANAHRHNGIRLAWLGHFDEAIRSLRRSLELDPLSMPTNINYAWCLFYAGRMAESDAQIEVAQEIDPSFWFVEYQLFRIARTKRDYAAAVEHLARAQELRDEPEAAGFIREKFKRAGWNGLMRAAIAEPERSKIWDYYLATFAAELGDTDGAFRLLNIAYEKYDQFILFAKIDPLMDPLRGDPRYNELLRKLGFPQ